MNPNAQTFKPAPRLRTPATQALKLKDIADHIALVKQEQTVEQCKLSTLYRRMRHQYNTLDTMAEATRRKLPGCLSQEQILEMMATYKTQSALYNEQYSNVNDITAKLLTLNTKREQLRAVMSSPSSSGAPKVATNSRTNNLFSGKIKISMATVDGILIQRNKKRSVGMKDNALPVIMESTPDTVDWSGWSDFDGDEERESEEEEEEENWTTSNLTDSSSISSETLSQRTASSCYSLNEMSPRSSACSLSPGVDSDEEMEDFLLEIMGNSNMETIGQEMDSILKMAAFGSEETITIALEKLLEAEGGSVESLCLMINCIIDEAVHSKPRVSTICVRMYAKMLWTINRYTKSLRSGQDDEAQWDSESELQIKTLDFFKLLWQRLMATFREAQADADRHTFVNVMVLLAELYNSCLLICSEMGEVIHCILGERNVERVGESEIDGLYEIFKRCSGRFQTSTLYEDIAYYLKVLSSVKCWKTFNHSAKGSHSASFMIDEMHRHFYGRDYVTSSLSN